MPPLLAGRIEYEPDLPPWREQLTQRTPMGSVIKTQVIYDEPFWRRDGLSGQATGDGEGSRVVFDNSPPDGSPGILLAFLEGDEARRLGREPLSVRRQAVVDSLVRYFGPQAARPERYLERDWQQEKWSGGCYGTLFGPNVWTRYGRALREAGRADSLGGHRDGIAVGRLHGRRDPLRRARRGGGPRGAGRPGRPVSVGGLSRGCPLSRSDWTARSVVMLAGAGA